MLDAHRLDQLQHRDASSTRAVHHDLERCDVLAREFAGIDDAGGGNDGGAVLVIVEDGNIEIFAQLLLDDEAIGALDVLEIDAAEAGAEAAHAFDEGLGVALIHLDIDGIHVGEALEEHRLAFHHRLGRHGPEIAKAQNGGAVRDHRDHIALGGVIVGEVGILGDRLHRRGHARAVGQRQIALGRHGLGGGHRQFSGLGIAVEVQGFFVIDA